MQQPGPEDEKGRLVGRSRESPGLDSTRGGEAGSPPDPDPSPAFTPGQRLGGRYQMAALLGRGGMGEVWRALDLKLNVEVALKFLHPRLLKEKRSNLEYLRQEVRAARDVISSNICRIYDLVELEGSECISMEYVDGMTLRQILDTRGRLNLREAEELAAELLSGLQAIHQDPWRDRSPGAARRIDVAEHRAAA